MDIYIVERREGDVFNLATFNYKAFPDYKSAKKFADEENEKIRVAREEFEKIEFAAEMYMNDLFLHYLKWKNSGTAQEYINALTNPDSPAEFWDNYNKMKDSFITNPDDFEYALQTCGFDKEKKEIICKFHDYYLLYSDKFTHYYACEHPIEFVSQP